MYNPTGNGDAEYLELLNISNQGVTLFDIDSNTAWRFTNGIEYEFPSLQTIALAPGERLVLTNNIPAFNSQFEVPSGTQILEWSNGKLSNGGEAIQLGRPGPTDANNFVQFVRVDRVNYEDSAPWPTNPDGEGPALTKISEKEYGNDFINWSSLAASPGDIAPGERFEDWAAVHGITDPKLDNDGDGYSNLTEYAFDLNPNINEASSILTMARSGSNYDLSFKLNLNRTDIEVGLEQSTDLVTWVPTETTVTPHDGVTQNRNVTLPTDKRQLFHRFKILQKPR
jgi:hypothetical protein